MSAGTTQEAGEFARFRTALSRLWLPVAPDHPRFAGLAQPGHDPSDLLPLISPDGLAVCAWRLVDPSHVTCAAFSCAGAYGSLVHPAALIWGAEVWAWERWPGVRFTVRLRRSPREWPDAASFFVQAGWKEVGIDGRGQVLLQREPLSTRREP